MEINISIFDYNNIKCIYGLDKKTKDVSNIIKKYIIASINNNNKIINLKVSNKLFYGDPYPNKVKNLNIKYNKLNINIRENNHFIIKLVYPKNVILSRDIDVLKNEFDNYKFATIFGKGPTFKNIPKNNNELRGAINQAANMIDGVDIICMNDMHNIYKINNSVYKKLKYLVIPQYMHVNQKFSKDGYFLKVLEYLTDKFNGKIIIYNLITSPKKNNLFISMETAISSANNLFEFISKFTDIKEINTFGIGVNTKENYHGLFSGNGTYDEIAIHRIIKNLNIIKAKYNINLSIY